MGWKGTASRLVRGMRFALTVASAVALLRVYPGETGAAVTTTAASPSEIPAPSTADGLTLPINADGTVRRAVVGGRTLPPLPGGGGFSMRMVGGNRNLLPNSGFETDSDADGTPDGWRFGTGASRPALDEGMSRTGRRSLRLRNVTRATSGEFSTTLRLERNAYYTLSAWFRSAKLLPSAPTFDPERKDRSPVRIIVDQIARGEVRYTSYLHGYSDTAGWNRQFVGFRVHRSVDTVRIRGLIEDGSGTAWIDDVHLSELFEETPLPVRGRVGASPDGSGALVQRAAVPGQPLRFEATYSSAADHIRVEGSVRNVARTDARITDRAFQLTYTLPVDASGWRWVDHLRKTRPITRGSYSYNANQTPTTGYLLQTSSRYPWATIYDDRSVLSVAIPLGEPRIVRMGYNTNAGLSITFDLGASRAAANPGAEATFSFIIYTADPRWPTRAPLAKYYGFYPEAFVRRTDPEREGIWWIALGLSQMRDTWRDYGLGLNMISLGASSRQQHTTWGLRYLPWDNERSIYAAAYNHQWAFYYDYGDSTLVPPYARLVAQLRRDGARLPANDAEARLRDEALATWYSAPRDPNGRMYYEHYGHYATFYQTLDRQPKAPLDWTTSVQRHQVQQAIDLAAGAGARLDAIHLDSTSGMRRWAGVDNYHRGHWAVTGMPLTFSYDSGLVVQRGIFAQYGHIARLAHSLHERGLVLSANFNGAEDRTLSWLGADKVDYFGVEASIQEWAKPFRNMTVDSIALQKRSLAYQRPISVLDYKTGEGTLTARELEGRIGQNAFYGIWTGLAKENQEGVDPVWMAWFRNEARSVYARYTPILRELGRAGWEPVTNARSSNPDVWVERFGALSGNDLYLTIRNETDAPQDYTLSVDLNRDDVSSVRSLRAAEEVTGTPLSPRLNAAGTRATITASIPARSTRVIRLAR